MRKLILHRLEELERETGQELISESELDIINDIWRRDQIREDCRVALRAIGSDRIVSDRAVVTSKDGNTIPAAPPRRYSGTVVETRRLKPRPHGSRFRKTCETVVANGYEGFVLGAID